MTDKRHWTRFNMMKEDPPAWALSVKLSVVAGACVTAFFVLLRYRGYNPTILGAIGVIVFILSPALASLRAKRQYFWYGFLPVCLAIPWTALVYLYICSKPPMSSFGYFDSASLALSFMLMAFGAWLGIAGPISVVKYGLNRTKLVAEQREAALAADMLIDVEGAWPPKPSLPPSSES